MRARAEVRAAKSRRLLFAPAAAAALLVGTQPVPATAASATVAADAETGTLSAWSATAGASITSGAAKQGAFGYEVNATNAPGYLNWSTTAVEQGHPVATFKTYLQVVSGAPGESVDLVTIRNTNTSHHFDLFVTADTKRFKWDLNNTDWGESAFQAVPGQWYLVQAQVEFQGTTYSAKVMIDGVEQSHVTSPGMVDGDVKSVWLGTSNAKTHRQRYDAVVLRVGDVYPPGWVEPPGPAAPPSVATGCLGPPRYLLTGTVTPNGAATTYRYEYGTGPSYGSTVPATAASAGSGTTPVKVTAEATGLAAGTTYNYRLIATNAAGTVAGSNRTFTTAAGTC